MQRRTDVMAVMVLALALAVPTARAGDREQEIAALERQHAQALVDIQQHNAAQARRGGAPPPEYTRKMMTLITRLQTVGARLARLKMDVPGGEYEGWSEAQLAEEVERLMVRQRQAVEAGHRDRIAALGEKIQELNQLRGQRRAEPDVAKVVTEGGEVEVITSLKAMQWLNEGDVERALNGMEAILAEGLQYENIGTAQRLASFYLELLEDTERCLQWVARIEERADRSLGPPPWDLGDERVRGWIGARSYALRERARALALQGSWKDARHLAEETGPWARDLVERLLDEAGDEPSEMQQQYVFNLALLPSQQTLHAARAARESGEDEEARKLFLRAREETQEVREFVGRLPDQAARAKVFMRNLLRLQEARIHQALGEPQASLEIWERFLEDELARIGGVESDQVGYYLVVAEIGRAEILEELGRLDEAIEAARRAEAFHRRSLEELAVSFHASLGWKPLYLQARLSEKAGRIQAAKREYVRTIDEIEELYRKMRSGRVKGTFLKMEECGEAYRRLVTIHIREGHPERALEYLERSKSAVLLDMLRSLPLRERELWPRELLEKERQLKQRMRELRDRRGDAGSGDGTRGGGGGAVEGELRKAYVEYDLFLRDVARVVSAAPDRTDEEGLDRVWYKPAAALAAAATGDRVVVAWFDDGEGLHAFVLRDGELTHHPLGSSRKIGRAARRLRRRVTARSSRWEEEARKVHDALLEPLAVQLEGAAELVLVPTGALFEVPFACLLDAEGRALASRVSLSFVSQVSVLATEHPPRKEGEGALVYADPDGSLPFARREARKVREVLGTSTLTAVLQGEDATEGSIKRRLGYLGGTDRPAVLHLATHGLMEKGLDLRSGLVMAPDELEDGALTFGEIFNDLDLRHTPVVVLSACNTAVGGRSGGDEVVGLARAFQYAGADWVVASLWEVSDEASAALMEAFHRQLARRGRGSVDAALRAAQEELRAAREEWRHPFYWAAFAAYRRGAEARPEGDGGVVEGAPREDAEAPRGGAPTR